MIQLENVTFQYKRKQVFKDFSLDIEKGKIHGLLGKNGAGKSTLLYLISGLLIPQKGKIIYHSENVSKRYPSILRDTFIVPEEFSLPNMSLKKYMSINKVFYPWFSEQDLKANLQYFDLDTDIHLGALSMGQKKKVFMSFALATNTSLLIMDEPTNGLDIPGKNQFKQFIASQYSENSTIIISTHHVQDVENLIDHVIIIEDNKALLNASVNQICQALRFVNGENNIDMDNSLYTSPCIQGYNALFLNKNDEESELNLETLFNATLLNPETINQLFKS